ncbi:MAG: acetoin utilization protein AcuC [Coriobacteriia bacterium]
MEVAFACSPSLDAYDLGPDHPFRPERVSRAVEMMREHSLIAEGALRPIEFGPVTREQLLRVHSAQYVDLVMRASRPGGLWPAQAGIGPGDTPAFPGMHDAAALVCGATAAAMRTVLSGEYQRAFSPAGGLHHAHRDYASGFCVYNDIAVAITGELERDPSLRIAYIDIDAHHGDGVQDVFYAEPRVLTISLHESGRYLFPGTGDVTERGEGAGLGAAINIPLPPLATDECYLVAFDEVVAPAVDAFAPKLIVAQCGVDAHWSDPLTTLGVTLSGFRALYERVIALTDRACAGRLVATGGGGYSWATAVPQAWTLLAGALTGVALPDSLAEEPSGARPRAPESVLDDTRATIGRLRDAGVMPTSSRGAPA